MVGFINNRIGYKDNITNETDFKEIIILFSKPSANEKVINLFIYPFRL